MTTQTPIGLFIQPACLQHRYIRHFNSSHIFERPERLRAVLLGVAAAVARLEEADEVLKPAIQHEISSSTSATEDLSSMLSSLSIASTSFVHPNRQEIVPPPLPPMTPGSILLNHPALQISHCAPMVAPMPYLGGDMKGEAIPSSPYLKDLVKWCKEAPEKIKETGCEIPSGLGLNQGDLYLGPGSILAIEGAIQTVCQAIDRVCTALRPALAPHTPPSRNIPHDTHKTPPSSSSPIESESGRSTSRFDKAFCAIRPPGHHCGEDAPSGFCYVNNVVVGAMHAYLQHDIDRAIIIDFDLHHGNGTQALVMPLNAASHAEDLALHAGKPHTGGYGQDGKRRRGWKGFYGSVHDIYSYPCEDGDVDLVKDASISLAAHGQYIENIHLQPYISEADFYTRIYPKYTALLEKAKVFMDETRADPERTVILISAGFDACEHEHEGMQRHDRRVPVSFYTKYTRDIADFANKYTEGKVVSVLEGGYSDRALTSGAMGHVIGLLEHDGAPDWWSEAELNNIERATKKKRTGKIAPFPTELASQTHLIRIHALLALFEGTTPDIAPSAQTTPQHGSNGRMTLRGRRLAGNEEVMETPPPVRRGRGRGVATPVATPRGKIMPVTPIGRGGKVVTPVKAERTGLEMVTPEDITHMPELKSTVAETKDKQADQGLLDAVKGLERVKLESSPTPAPTIAQVDPTIPAKKAEPIANIPLPADPPQAEATELPKPKILLRFRQPSSTVPPTDASVAPPSTLYPPLPSALPTGIDQDEVRVEYREVSVGNDSATSGEYETAVSEVSLGVLEETGVREVDADGDADA